jgi:hypothetical protein
MRIPAIVLLPESPEEPEEIVLDGLALRLAVVQKGQHTKVSNHFDKQGFYMLFSRQAGLGYQVYVGKAATQTVRQRVGQHKSSKEYDVAVMVVRDNAHGFNSAQAGWLEGRFVDLFRELPWVELKNGANPSDDTLPAYDQEVLESFVEPISRVLNLLGFSTDSKASIPAVTKDLKPKIQESPGRAAETGEQDEPEELDTSSAQESGRDISIGKEESDNEVREFAPPRVANLLSDGYLKAGDRLKGKSHNGDTVYAELQDHAQVIVEGGATLEPIGDATNRLIGGGKSRNTMTSWKVERDGQWILLRTIQKKAIDAVLTDEGAIMKGRRKPAIDVLQGAGKIAEGTTLWLLPNCLPANIRPTSAGDQRLSVVLRYQTKGKPTCIYKMNGKSIERPVSWVWLDIRRALSEEVFKGKERAISVSDNFSLSPGGPNLKETCLTLGLWE